MKIAALLESRKRLVEGGNLSIGSHEAQHLDLKVTNRNYMVPKLNELLNAINAAYAKMYKQPLWSPKLLASGEFLSGSSLHFFNVKGIDDETFVAKKPTVGDIDTMVDKTKESNLQQFLTAYTDKQIGPAVFLGFQRGNEQFSGLFELQDPPVKVQIDFEFVAFEKDAPTDWAKFSHSSSWEDLQAGVKGVFHKWLIQAFTTLTRKDFLLRKMVGRGKLRAEQDVPTTDNMVSFAVSSKEGGGLRAKYEPVVDDKGQPLVIDGLPVMREAPTAGYQQNIGQIFSTILGKRLSPKQAQALQKQFWSFTGLLQIMNTLMTPEEKQEVLNGFLQKTIGPGAQGMYKNNPDKDIKEKTLAINTMLQALNMPKPANLDQMLNTYRQAYKMTGTDEGIQSSKDIVKSMAKNTLDEAAPDYKRKGIQHIYNPGSSTEMKDQDFINFCREIVQDGGKLQGIPINLKVDGAGVRFGRTAQGEPFFMTSRVDRPLTKDNIGDFEAYGRSQGQTDEQLARTQNYDKALATIVNAKFMKDIPPDTIVTAEMLFNPMAQQEDGGYKFVNIPYDPKKLGKTMTLVPISVKQYSTGEASPDATKIKQALVKDSTPDIKMINNTLSHKGIDVSKLVNPIVKNAEALENAVKQRGDTPDKQKAKAILSKARQALSSAIINSPIPGKDQLGDMIEGLVINMPSGVLAKVTSPDMQQKMAAKQVMNKKPTESSNRTKPAVVTIGSFVGHKGHQQLIQQTIDTAKKVGGDPYIYVSPVMGADDPIPPADKVKTLQKLYPQYAHNIQVWDPRGTPVKKIEKELVLPANSPYNKIILLVGDDRYEGFKNWMDSLEKRMKDPASIAKYGGTQNQVDFETVRTERDPSKGGTGISFTQLRNKLKEPNTSEQDKLNYWMQAFDGQTLGQDWIKHLMDTTAKNMGIQQQQQAIKEYIERVKPLLPHASSEQKAKIYESLARAKAKLVESSLEELANTSLDVKEPKDMYNVNDRKQTTYKLFKFKSGKNTFLINFTVKGAPAFGKKQNWNAVNVAFGVKEKQDDYSFGDEMNTDLTGRNKNQFLIYSTVINTIRRFITEYNTEIDEIIMQGAGERQEAMYQRFFQSAGKYFPGWHYNGKHSLVRDVPRPTGKKVQEQGVAEGSGETKYKIKRIGSEGGKDYYISPNTGKKVYKKAQVGDHETPNGEHKPKLRMPYKEGVAEAVDIGQEWMSDTELDQYVPERLQQQWRELLGYDENGNPSALWANLTGGYEPDVNDPQHRRLMVKVANKWFAAKKIPNVKFFDVKDADDELEWLVQIGQQGLSEGKSNNIPTIGINVRTDGDIDYASLIVDGEKKYESRKTDSLRPYVGKTVGIVRTGNGPAVAIGQVTIGEPILVDAEKFNRLRKQHLVPQGSKFDIDSTGTKYLYPMIDPVRWNNEKPIKHKGIVSRKIQEQGVAEAEIQRKESFRSRITPDIEYIVRDDSGNIVRHCKTKKEAKMWYDMITLSQEEMWAKYPQLKVNEELNELMKMGATIEPMEEDFSDDLNNIYAMHPQPEKSEQVVFQITDKNEDEFVSDWMSLPEAYQQEFGHDIPLWDTDDLSAYPNITAKRCTYEQYVNLVGNYLRSQEMADSALSSMKGITNMSESSDYLEEK